MRDVTPTDMRSTLRVLYMPSSTDANFVRRCRSVLSQAELQAAAILPTHNDKVQFNVRRAFRRCCGACVLGSDAPLSNVQFMETESGRPYLQSHPATSFSFSACSLGVVAAWSSRCRVGIDIEDPARSVEPIEIAEKYFAAPEIEAVRQAQEPDRKKIFLRFWTLKEAALKSIGQGLPFGIDAFAFTLSPDLHIARAPVEYGGEKMFQGHIINDTDGCASLVIH